MVTGVTAPDTATRALSTGVSSRPATFKLGRTISTGVKEASDLVSLPDGRVLIVSDIGKKVAVVDLENTSVDWLKLPKLPHGEPSQFEGIAFDASRNLLFLSREEARQIAIYKWNPSAAERPAYEEVIHLKSVGGPKNKGVEGLVLLDGAHSPTGRPQLIAAQEKNASAKHGKPRELLMLETSGRGDPKPIVLHKKVREAIKDISALALDPISGNLFIASDSSTVVEVKLTRKRDSFEGQLVGNPIEVRGADGKRLEHVEGITFTAAGDLLVLTENDGIIHTLKRVAPAPGHS